MAGEADFLFDDFRVDIANERLWRGQQTLRLTHKAFAVLRYLVEHPGRIVTKAELFQALWPETVVSDAVLAVYVRKIRLALGESPKTPRFIETVPRQGYRFIDHPRLQNERTGEDERAVPEPRTVAGPSPLRILYSTTELVGRTFELAQLHRLREQALGGERQLVFVTGEPGIGKTALVGAFLDHLTTAGDLGIGHGQCIEHYGAGEAYLPVLSALGQLGREPEGGRFVEILRQYAPTWLVQLPAFLGAAELEALQRKTLRATRERMLREMTEALEALTAERPLALVLEDLHWSDAATLDLLALLARRRQPARLLVIGTYRPMEVLGRVHPLYAVTQELYAHGLCTELALGALSETDVAAYLIGRFPQSALPTRLARVLYQRTEGNPLFLVSAVEELVTRGQLAPVEGNWTLQSSVDAVAIDAPETFRQLFAAQGARLGPKDRQLLEAASLAGAEFSAASAAAAIAGDVREVEEHCEELARRQQFLRRAGISEWPDGTVTACYGFRHAVYQHLWHERVTVGRLQQWHYRIGTRKEAGYGERAAEVAAELAVHFEQGRDYRRALRYLQLAGESALQRSAHQEAVLLLSRGLELLKTLPNTRERRQCELELLTTLGLALTAIHGFGAPSVEHTYSRAQVLCQQLGETPQTLPVLSGLVRFHLARGEVQTAQELGEQCLRLARRGPDRALLLESSRLLGMSLFYGGEFTPALQHIEQGLALYDPPQHQMLVFRFGNDPGVVCLCYASHLLWFRGYLDQALQKVREALTLAQQLAHPHSLLSPLLYGAWLHQFRREWDQTQERAEAVIALAREQGFALFLALSSMLQGWAVTKQGQGEQGMVQLRQGLAALRATGAELWRPYFLGLLAEVQGTEGQVEEGLNVLTEALTVIEQHGECWWAAELYRLQGELLLKSAGREPGADAHHKAEACFRHALDIARRQSVKPLELRAVTSLSRLWKQQDKRAKARQFLAEVYSWFTEGFGTKDLQEARVLLAELS